VKWLLLLWYKFEEAVVTLVRPRCPSHRIKTFTIWHGVPVCPRCVREERRAAFRDFEVR
jgi:hypothetical protein